MGRRQDIALKWNESQTYAVGPDGTHYMIQREEIRQEGVWYTALYRESDWGTGHWKGVPIGDVGHRVGPQRTRIKRYARQRAGEAG